MAALSGGGDELLLGGERREMMEGMLDYKGVIAVRSKTGGWKSAALIMGVEILERFAFYGISCNLITYLTGPLRQSIATAAVNVNTWFGVASMLPLLGAFVSDSYLGRYRTVLISLILYTMGFGLLTLSAIMLPSQSAIHCQDTITNNSSCFPPLTFQVILCFISLYIVAIAQGANKSSGLAFGADQFDGLDPIESRSRSSFFNWWVFALSAGTIISFTTLTYIQDNISWVLGFGIPCISMGMSLFIFPLGAKTYRYSIKDDKRNPFVKIGQVFVVAAKNWRSTTLPTFSNEEEAIETSQNFKFLDKALIKVSRNQDNSGEGQTVCSISQVKDAKSILQLVPIWCTCLMYGVVFAQVSTFFTKQGSTMERSIGSSFEIPPASLRTFTSLFVISFVPIYDFVVVPIARVFTKKPSGITMLQRIGFGLVLSVITMITAALIERKRLKTAVAFGLIDVPGATIPMSICWLIPQYCLFGVADVFIMIGLQEFFYDQVPEGLRSLGVALYWCILGVGSFFSGFLISVIENATSDAGRNSWFSDNLNRGHLDYFYWLLAGLTALGFVVYLHFSRLYVYSRQSST